MGMEAREGRVGKGSGEKGVAIDPIKFEMKLTPMPLFPF